jgi:hypothetical protein
MDQACAGRQPLPEAVGKNPPAKRPLATWRMSLFGLFERTAGAMPAWRERRGAQMRLEWRGRPVKTMLCVVGHRLRPELLDRGFASKLWRQRAHNKKAEAVAHHAAVFRRVVQGKISARGL